MSKNLLFTTALAAMILLSGCESKVVQEELCPEIDDVPQVGQLYQVTPAGALTSTGSQWYGSFRKGAENRVMVYFCGGGVSVDAYTAARGFSAAKGETGYYCDDFGIVTESQYLSGVRAGIISTEDVNPFKDWSIVLLPYMTGDFHCGQGTRQYTGLDGEEHTIYYNGYNNFKLLMEKLLPYLGTPDALLVTGSSAGGFGTAIMSDAVANCFPQTRNVTSVVDAAFIKNKGWKAVAALEWQAPPEIVERINGDDITLDCLKALHKDKPYVKILYGSTARDRVLTFYQHYFNDGTTPIPTAEDARSYQMMLGQMVAEFRKSIPDGGVNIWNDGRQDEAATVTTHTIECGSDFFADFTGKGSFASWIKNAVDGKVETLGLELLQLEE